MLRWLHDSLFEKRSSSDLQLDALDGLRGLAVLFVLLSHLSNVGFGYFGLDFGGSGAYGVYLFFTLSAFLLTLPLLSLGRSELASRGRWIGYALRRVLRVLPLYFVVLVLHHLLHDGLLAGYLIEMDAASLVRHLTLREGISVYWTIPVEFKYYLVLPFVALVYVAIAGLRSLPVSVLTALAIAASLVVWKPELSRAEALQLGPYLPVFLLGSFAAFVHRALEARTAISAGLRWSFEGLAWLGLGLALLHVPAFWNALTNEGISKNYFHGEYLRFGLIWAATLVAMLHGHGFMRRLLGARVLRGIGIVSFSLYLLHVPVMRVIGREALEWPPWIAASCVTLCALALSLVSFLLIERPATRSRTARNFVRRVQQVGGTEE